MPWGQPQCPDTRRGFIGDRPQGRPPRALPSDRLWRKLGLPNMLSFKDWSQPTGRVHTAIVIAMGVAAVWALLLLAMQMLLIWRVRIFGDLALYFSVARGMLNGLHPYHDLFESKPPAIFFLSALSLWSSGDNTVYSLACMVAVLGLVGVLVLFAIHESRTRTIECRAGLGLIAFLWGTALALYTAHRGGNFQTEILGAFFGSLYVLTLAWNKDGPNGWQILLCALWLLGAIGMKEPFLLSLTAAALLVSPSVRVFVRGCLVPLLIALVVGIVMMWLLGYLDAYLHLYLPVMFSSRLPTLKTYSLVGVVSSHVVIGNNPLWLRGLDFLAVFEDVVWYAPLPGLAVVIAGLWIANPALKSRLTSRVWRLVGVICVGMWMSLIRQLSVTLAILEILQYDMPWHDEFFVRQMAGVATLGVICLGVLGILFSRQRQLCGFVMMSLCALYLGTLAAAAAGEFGRHCLFTVPVYVAACMVGLRFIARVRPPATQTWVHGVLGVALVWMTFQSNSKVSFAQSFIAQSRENELADSIIHSGRELDAVMTRCGFSRYLPLGPTSIIGSMSHSPYLLWYPIQLAVADRPNAHFRAQLQQALAETQLIVLTRHIRDAQPEHAEVFAIPEFQRIVIDEFSPSEPPCARPFRQPDYLSVLFRASDGQR